MLLETEEGWVSIREYGGTQKKLEQQCALMEKIRESGFPHMDCLRRNLEGDLISCDREGNGYVVRDWCRGRECDARSVTDIERAVRRLAGLHTVMHMEVNTEYVRESLICECRRHNAEIAKPGNLSRKSRGRTLLR